MRVFKLKSAVSSISLLVLSGALYAARYPAQVVQVDLGLNDDSTMTITASTFGALLVRLDSSKLRLFARPHVVRDAAASGRRLAARIDPAVLALPPGFSLSHPPAYSVQNFSMAVTLSGPPGRPGIYDVWAQALDGFAAAQGVTTVPLSERTGFTAAFPTQVSWPDESGNDSALARLRKKLVGRVVYGYGGIAISCRPDWTRFYSAATPVRVRSIERKHGFVSWLGTGSSASAPYVTGAGFIAFYPLSIVVDEPSAARYPALGSNFGVKGTTTDCPAIELADWQIDTTLSLHPPPTGMSGTPAALRVGMARDEVVWTRGYPNEVGTRTALRPESTWHYGVAMGRYAVTFDKDRIVSFTSPSNL